MLKYFSVIILLCITLIDNSVFARPYYAARSGFASCTVCHISPRGGGMRNAVGQSLINYLKPASKYITSDWRLLYYSPKEKGEAPQAGGLSWMAGEVHAHLPITEIVGKENATKVSLQASYELVGFLRAPEDIYVRVKRYEDGAKYTLLPQYIILGRFKLPFGLATDEHRTFVRMQTLTSNKDWDSGVMLSSNILPSLHYDFSLLRHFKHSNFLVADKKTTGLSFNLRWTSPSALMLLGSSYVSYNLEGSDDPQAYSAYMLLPMESVTNSWIKGALGFEVSEASNFNSRLYWFYDYIIANNAQKAKSRAYYAYAQWDFLDNISLLYKWDKMIVDKAKPKDAFVRHGFGVHYKLSLNTFLKLRYEKAANKKVTPVTQDTRAGYDAFFAILQINL